MLHIVQEIIQQFNLLLIQFLYNYILNNIKIDIDDEVDEEQPDNKKQKTNTQKGYLTLILKYLLFYIKQKKQIKKYLHQVK